ncbi:MAG: GDP-L-fucose synthase [Treponemataceae bacterium]
MEKTSKIYIAGHRGLVGSALLRNLQKNGYNNIIVKSSKELDLTNQKEVDNFFQKEQPEYIFVAAAKVGGIHANNTYPADFIYINMMIASNVIHSSYVHKVKKLLFLGSSCIYPKLADQPMKEDCLLTGSLEQTNEAYAVAKIAGLKLCQYYRKQYGVDFISAMPTNLYGINDNFDLQNSHVLPALLRKFHEAKTANQKSVILWGTGKAKREFLYVDDLADALVFLMNNYSDESHVNIGTGEDLEIAELAQIIKNIVGFEGEIMYDTTKPDGTPRKLLDVSKINNLGWKAQTSLENGIKATYEWYKR